jgi:antitoxin MazE
MVFAKSHACGLQLKLNQAARRNSIDIVDTETRMRVTVKKWGNSASVRIPAAVMAAAKLRLDQTVDVRADRGRIIIEPVRAPAVDLDALIAGITDANRHDETDFGKPVGKEQL